MWGGGASGSYHHHYWSEESEPFGLAPRRKPALPGANCWLSSASQPNSAESWRLVRYPAPSSPLTSIRSSVSPLSTESWRCSQQASPEPPDQHSNRSSRFRAVDQRHNRWAFEQLPGIVKIDWSVDPEALA